MIFPHDTGPRDTAQVTRGRARPSVASMVRILPPSLAALAAGLSAQGAVALPPPGPGAGQAAQGPVPAPVSAAGIPAAGNLLAPPGPPARPDTPAEARGRKLLSTAFVRVGPDGRLAVTLRDGRRLALRDVAMGPRSYCGRPAGDPAEKRFCGGYAEVAAARPDDAAPSVAAVPADGRPAPRGR